MKQQGLSLIELMISLLLSSLLLLALMQLFSNTTQTDRAATALARVQERGRVALEVIARDTRRAGYPGCQLPSQPLSITGTDLHFPADALAASAQSLTLRYAQSKTELGVSRTPTPKIAQHCDQTPLYLYQASYSNGACSIDTKTPCIKMTRTVGSDVRENQQDLVSGARIEAIQLGIPEGGTTQWKSAATINPQQLAAATQVRIDIHVEDPRQNIARRFSTTVALRNRL